MSFQRNNQQWVLANAAVLNPEVITSLKQNDYRNASTSLLKCVGCGKTKVTGPIVKFFNFQPDRLLCYDCQGNRQNFVPKQESKKSWHGHETITQKQKNLLVSLIRDRFADSEEMDSRLRDIDELTKTEASRLIGELLG